MPALIDKVTVGAEFDRRRKLTDEQRDEIRHKYATGEYIYTQLAEEYGVSKKVILLTVNPESKRKNAEYAKTHWKNQIRTKEERTRTAREHRAYKQQLLDAGKIGNK